MMASLDHEYHCLRRLRCVLKALRELLWEFLQVLGPLLLIVWFLLRILALIRQGP